MAEDNQEKTEDPTPKKLEDARQKGEVPSSKEFANFIIFLGLSLAFYFSAGFMLERVISIFERYFQFDGNLIEQPDEFVQSMMDIIKYAGKIVAPLFAAAFVFAIISYTSQFGILFTLKKMEPKLDNLNFINGIKKKFSKDTAMEFFKSISKVTILGAIFYLLLKSEYAQLVELGVETVPSIFFYTMEVMAKFALAFIIFMAVLGIIDFIYQRWSYQEKQKMSKQEVKDEFKQREGDPHVKSRIRQLQREVARGKQMDDVPNADVVVANPTHVAVALKYERGEMMAPMVVAKGAGYIAYKIKERALGNGVPILEKKQLARYLYRNSEVGQFVPESLYSAIAELLAYVYRMKEKYKTLGGWLGDEHLSQPNV